MLDRKFILVATTLWSVLISTGRSAEFETGPTVKVLLETKKGLKSSLTTCCKENELYSVGVDYCYTRWGMNITEAPFSPIYSSEDDKIIRGFHQTPTTGSLRPCPSGQVAKSSTAFRIYDDGSLKTADGFEVSEGDFCLNRIYPTAETNEDGELSAVFAARFCVVDECADAGGAGRCVHKCCPMGMAFKEGSFQHNCLPDSKPFSVPFHHRDGSKAEADPSVKIRDGIPFNCEGRGLHKSNNRFYILPDGTMHLIPIRGSNINSDEVSKYCVDHFIDESNKTELAAHVCTKSHFFEKNRRKQIYDVYLRIYPYFLLASSFFLVATFVVYALLPQLRNTSGVSIMCHTALMGVIHVGRPIIFFNNLTDVAYEMHKKTCVAIAVVGHFVYLANFTWLNVHCFDIWFKFKNMAGTYSDHRRMRSDHKLEKKFLFYSLYAWSVPLLFVGFGQLTDNVDELFHNRKIIRPGFGVNSCWFHTRESYITYLFGPVAALLLLNTLFFILTTAILCRSSFDTRSRRDRANFHYTKLRFRAIFILFVLMGMPWMPDILSALFSFNGLPLSFSITIQFLNVLAAVFIFVVFVCNPKVWKLLVKKYPSLRRLDRLCPSCMRYNVEAAEQGCGLDDSDSDLQKTAV